MRTFPPVASRVDPSDVRSEIMTFDEQLQRAFEAMTDRLRDDIARHARAVAGELSAFAEAEREQAACSARQAAEGEADERLSAAVAAAELDAMARGREEGRAEGIVTGRDEGWEAGRIQGLEEGRRIARTERIAA